MTDEHQHQRYSRLAPFTSEQQLALAIAALDFFSPMNYERNLLALDREPTPGRTEPFDGVDFLSFIERADLLQKARRYQVRVAGLLARLESVGLLTFIGRGKDVFVGKKYYFLKELTTLERKGLLWLSEALGPQFIRREYGPITVQLTGQTTAGDVHAGTGLVVAENWILTCAHVLKDMRVHEQQTIRGSRYTVVAAIPHPTIDVGLVKMHPAMNVLKALAFRDPDLSEPLYTLGYPRIPLARSAPLVMQSGEVTSQQVTLLHGSEVFLYSATARPGNSGGPIIAATGHVLGIVTEELTTDGERILVPFHAGIKTSTITSALSDLEPSISLPVEDYE